MLAADPVEAVALADGDAARLSLEDASETIEDRPVGGDAAPTDDVGDPLSRISEGAAREAVDDATGSEAPGLGRSIRY